jgi:hypothetical protein
MSVMTIVGRRRRRALRSIAVGAAVAAASTGLGILPAQAASGQRVNLRVLVVANADPQPTAWATELGREGIPYTMVTVGAAGRPTVDAAFLEDSTGTTANFQAVILPNQAGGGLSADEMTALSAYEAKYGVRQVDGYEWTNPNLGLNYATYTGPLDGGSMTVTPDGLSGPFTYLKGSLPIDNFDPAQTETFGYLSTPLATLPVGQTFTPLLNATSPDGVTTGVLAGVFAHDGREELVMAGSYNESMQWFNEVAPGMVSWATRGIHLGYQRNYFNVQVDDVFLPDGRWSVSGNCTPGDNCVDSTVTTTDIKMSPADVTNLVNWQNTRGFKLDMVFNGGGAELAKAPVAGESTSDPAANTAFLTNQSQFRWINHTYTHAYLGCIQIAPTVAGQDWHCATTATDSPRQDPEVASQLDPTTKVYYAAQNSTSGTPGTPTSYDVTEQVGDNITWATTNGLTNFDKTELVTGEHSGLASLPEMPNDNPFLAPALTALGVKYTASDASREADTRVLTGSSIATVPRHPMNIFYNAGTYQDEVDEYNWIYTSKANGGSDICTANPATSTCITPLDATSEATATTSFNSYIKPIEVRNALKYVLTNDPRPFYAHQSNLAEDGILYPVLDGIVSTYTSVYNATGTPLVQTGLTGQYQALSRMNAWKAAATSVDGYVDSAGVHLPATSVSVPVTLPAGSTGATLESYAGSLSGWLGGGSTVTPPNTAGGYLVTPATTAPSAPTIGTATPGSTTATVTWTTPASNGGSPITGYVIRSYAGTSTTPSATTVSAPADATSAVVTGLVNGTAYRFDVAAVNAIGTGAASAQSAAVTPLVSLAPVPVNVVAQAGNASVSVTWGAPTQLAGITGYRVRAFVGTGTTVAKTVTVAAGQLSAAITGLVNGTGYTVEVATLYGTAAGPASVRSALVTPALTAQSDTAPTITSVAPGNASATVSWQPPTVSNAGTPTGYRIRAYLGTTTVQARSVTVAGTATTATVTGLLNGIAYSFDVTAVYASGNGPVSARSVAVVPASTAPSAPTIGTAASGAAGGSVNATARWSAPASNGGSAITGYRVTAIAMSAAGAPTGTTVTSGLVSSLLRSYTMTLPAGQYAFTVVAVNSKGTSLPSAVSNTVTAR